MAAYPTFTNQDIADYSGRDVSEYEAYGQQALKQATLLFKLGTCLAGFPDDPIQAELAEYAILAMADAIVLAQPYQKVLSNPFTSESIGSYSYSKMAAKVVAGLPTGVSWFDIAIGELSVCGLNDGVPTGGGMEIFESDGIFAPGYHANNTRFLSPQDIESSKELGYNPDPSDRNPYGVPRPPEGGGDGDSDLDDGSQDEGILVF